MRRVPCEQSFLALQLAMKGQDQGDDAAIGGFRLTLSVASHQRAAASSRSSANAGPMNWMARGSPAVSRPDGMVMAGKPAKLAGELNEGSPVVVRSRGAGPGAAGARRTSTCWNNGAMSWRNWRRMRC